METYDEPKSLEHTEEDMDQLKLQIEGLNEKYEVLKHLVQDKVRLYTDFT